MLTRRDDQHFNLKGSNITLKRLETVWLSSRAADRALRQPCRRGGRRESSFPAPGGAEIQATSPYCFILRHSVTVLIFSASAAWRRLP
jgi:hypothetical protein